MKAGERVQRAVAAVERASATSASADELLERVAGELRTYIPHDASMVFGIDPVTMIATEPSRIEGMDAALCDMFWHLEFHEQDTALFTDLASGERVSAMRLSLGDRTARSIRFRDFMRPQGFGDELRGALQTGHHTWGVLGLYRDTVHAPFGEEDLEIVRAIGDPVARALRTWVRTTSPWLGQPSAPGLLVVDHKGRPVSANSEALCWLRDLWPDLVDSTEDAQFTSLAARACSNGVVEAPTPSHGTGLTCPRDRRRTRACAGAAPAARPARPVGRAPRFGPRRSGQPGRLGCRGDRGRQERRGRPDHHRVVLAHRARTRGARRDRARGSTGEIAAELFLSPHTVRDHVKTVFEKVGVSSRGELVARLFGEHYSDRFHETMVHD